MMIFDGLYQRKINEEDLPNQIELGRFIIENEVGSPKELTYAQYPTTRVIHQELLLEKNISSQKVFVDFNSDIQNSNKEAFDITPLIKRVRNNLGLNKFEELLEDKILHIEEVFKEPHSLLTRDIEKVHVSRANRISSRSYQHLASHTEDWYHKSIVSFKPSRVLNEILDLNFDVFENQLAVAFVDRALKYLNSRLKEIQDLEEFTEIYIKLLDQREDERGWYKKIERNLQLIGKVYEDKYTGKQGEKKSSVLNETGEKLKKIKTRLAKLKKSEVYNEVNKRSLQSIVLRNTNVLINHKHYRYLKPLWMELNKIRPGKTKEELEVYEQYVIKGVRDYGVSIFVYCLKEYLGYKLEGDYNAFNGTHSIYPSVEITRSAEGIFNLKVEKEMVRVVVLASELRNEIRLNKDTCVLYLSDSSKSKASNLIPINPLDVDSVERIGSFLKKKIVHAFIESLNETFPLSPKLISYKEVIQKEVSCIEFLSGADKLKYRFTSKPQVRSNKLIEQIKKDPRFIKIKSKSEAKEMIGAVEAFMNDFEKAGQQIKSRLICTYCDNELSTVNLTKGRCYLKCASCGTTVDKKENEVVCEIRAEKYKNIQEADWGMDYVKFIWE